MKYVPLILLWAFAAIGWTAHCRLVEWEQPIGMLGSMVVGLLAATVFTRLYTEGR